MTPRDLNGHHVGETLTVPIANGAPPVTGTISRVRHAATGTYIELEGELGVYQTDTEGEVTS